jgi:lysozyme family protein
MPAVNLSSSLRSEYQDLFDTCLINPAKVAEVESLATKIESNKPRYAKVGGTKIPWYFIGVIHNMESSLNFTKHLHNGDPLTKRTVQVPAGRPATGSPPFTWEASAADALGMKKLFEWTDWTIPGLLYKLEQYNGFSYRLTHPHVKSPYLWSYSNHYTRGKFIADHVFSETAVSKQCGGAVLLRRLSEKQAIKFDKTGTPALGNTPATSGPTVGSLAPLVKYAPKTFSQVAADLQAALNKLPGIFLKVDGLAGKRTSDAVKALTGNFLAGDPRA